MEKVGGDFSMQKGGVVIAYVRVRLLAVDAVEQSRQAAATLQELLFDNRSPFSYIVVADFTTGGSADIYFFSNLPSVAPPVVDRAGSDRLKRRLVDAVNLALPLRVAPFVGTFHQSIVPYRVQIRVAVEKYHIMLVTAAVVGMSQVHRLMQIAHKVDKSHQVEFLLFGSKITLF